MKVAELLLILKDLPPDADVKIGWTTNYRDYEFGPAHIHNVARGAGESPVVLVNTH